VGEIPVITGGRATVKSNPLLFWLLTETTTFPVEAPAGTGTVILPAAHAVGVANEPLNVTVLVLCDAPKLLPVIVTEVPSIPEVGERLETLGPGLVTVNGTPLLA
jgi:hypothetical protein